MRSLRIVAGLLLVAGCATSYTPMTNTRSDLVAYVERAAALVQQKGLAACSDFSTPAWMAGDWYIFVSQDNVPVCHPARPDMVGQDQSNLRDVSGVYISRELSARANSPEGRGWVEYMWPRPGQSIPVRKSAYVMAVIAPDGKRYAVGSGGYEMPR